MALNIPPLRRPAYLQRVDITNAKDYKTRCVLHIFEHGRLSTAPCGSCVENGVDCVVAKSRASRCMRCAYVDTKVSDCQAEGVRNSMTQPNPQAERQSVFPVQPTSTTRRPAKSQSNTTRAAPTKQKRKRGVSDPADALEMVAKRLRGGTQAPNGVEGTYGSIIPKFKDLAPAPTTITTTTTTTQATVTEHSYGPTAPRIAGQASDRTSLAMKTLATQNLHNVRLAPFGSKEYDLAIRTKDRVAWAQWANDLHKEIRSLRYVQDLGPYTMGVIAMMTQDGVWPTGNEVDVGEE